MPNTQLILGSKSPRRQALLSELGYSVEIRIHEIEEIYPEHLESEKVPEYLAKLKSQPLIPTLSENEVLVTADTVVLLNNKVLGKPKDRNESIEMLKSLSGKMHTVVTGVCLSSSKKQFCFSTKTDVYFSELTIKDIEHYVEQFSPFDKAGSYGIQEWIGYIGVEKIDGCYYNVMGLPLHNLYRALKSQFSD